MFDHSGLTCFLQLAFLALPLASAFPTLGNNTYLQARQEPVYDAGPVISSNFPDPCIIEYHGTWYSFATNTQSAQGKNINVQIASSTDFKSWSLVMVNGQQADALPSPPGWVDQSAANTWAPDVNILDDGTFVMYFSASTNQDTSKHCIGAATSHSIIGPYTPQQSEMFCPLSQGGAIDASGFKDYGTKGTGWGTANDNNDQGWTQWNTNPGGSWPADDSWGPDNSWSMGGQGGQRYVAYKIDGNSIGHGGNCGNTVSPIIPTPIMLQPVAADGVTLQGNALTLLNNNGGGDSGIVEAPSLVRNGYNVYVLFFSTGCFVDGSYTVSYATSTNGVGGPYTRASSPLLQTGDNNFYGPGGADVLWDARHIVFHADVGTNSNVRQLYVGEFNIEGTNVVI